MTLCLLVANIKFAHLILWLEGLCTDDDANNDARQTKHDCTAILN